MSLLNNIAGRFDTIQRGVSVTPLNAVKLANANPKRYAIGFSIAVSDVITISIGDQTGTDLGIFLNTGTPLWLYVPQHGSLPMQEFWGRNPTGVYQLTVIEIIDTRG